jgi:hypothetical protein
MDASADTTMLPAESAPAESPSEAATTPAFAEHIERIRAHRAELRESVAAVELALESPIARGGAWRERVRAALAELAHDFDDHIALTESPGGIYDRAKRSAPRLAGAVNRLLAEHRLYREKVHGYLAVLEHGGQLADMPAFREELTVLLGRLVRHRQAGGDLVYEAYSVDLGGSG